MVKLTLLTQCHPRFRPVLVTIAACFVHACNGAADVSGNLVPYVASYLILRQGEFISTGSSAWIVTVVIGTKGLCGGFAGWVYQNYGCHPILPLGALLMTLGCLSTYWAIQESLQLVYVTMAVFGIGVGAVLVPTLALPLKWFPQRKGLIAGITLSSTAVGTAVFVCIETAFVNPTNDQTNTVVNGLPLFDNTDLLDRTPWVFIVLSIIFAVIHGMSLPFLYDPWTVTDYENIEEQNIPLSVVLRSSTYIFLLTSYFLINFSFSFVLSYYKVFGETFIDDDYFLGLLVVLASFFNIAGRIFWGYITDHIGFQFAAVASQGGFTMLMFLLHLSRYGGKAMFTVWLCAMFFCFGSESSAFPAGLAQTFGMDCFGSAWGIMITFSGLSSFLLSVIADQAMESIGFFGVIVVSGCSSLVAVIMLSLIHKTDRGEALR